MSLRQAPAVRELGIFGVAYLVYFGVRPVTAGTAATATAVLSFSIGMQAGVTAVNALLGVLAAMSRSAL